VNASIPAHTPSFESSIVKRSLKISAIAKTISPS
jgi:hypothetical protein